MVFRSTAIERPFSFAHRRPPAVTFCPFLATMATTVKKEIKAGWCEEALPPAGLTLIGRDSPYHLMGRADTDLRLDTDVTEHPVRESASELTPEAIDFSYAPRPRAGAISRSFDDELLVVDPRNGRIHALNSSAAIIWDCLDGRASLAEVADRLAEAFGTGRQAMRADVLAAARQFGQEGLLEGVAARPASYLPAPTVLEPGQPCGPVVAWSADGQPATLPRPDATGTLLVNWSPFCGYFGMIAERLEAMREPLERTGVQLVLLTAGSPADSATWLREHGLSDAAFYRIRPPQAPAGPPASDSEPGAAETGSGPVDVVDPFRLMGTPVAYLLDGDGRVAAPLATGAYEVSKMAGEAAGLPPEVAEPTSSLPVGAGLCGLVAAPTTSARQWSATIGIAVADKRVGVRVDSDATESLLRRALRDHALPADLLAPPNFSVVLAEPDAQGRGPARRLSLLLVGDRTIVRSRSPRRVLEALDAQLSALAEPPESSLLLSASGAGVVDGKAILLPPMTSRRLELVQGRLARLGVALADGPEVVVDPAAAELVIHPASTWVAAEVLEDLPGLPPSVNEHPPIPPGRYPLAAWVVERSAPAGGGVLPISRAIAGALETLVVDLDRPDEAAECLSFAMDELTKLFERVPALGLPDAAEDRFATTLADVVAELLSGASAD